MYNDSNISVQNYEIKSLKSWAYLDLDNILENKTEINKTKTKTNANPKIEINQILDLDITKIREISEKNLLEYMIILINNIKQIENFNKTKHLKYLNLITHISEYLANKHNLTITIREMKKDIIPRNSYRFCINNNQCINFYIKKRKCINGQHFVYNFVKEDIDQIIYHINNNNEQNINYSEINISITTIKYVIEHMYNEIINKLN